MEPQGWNQWFWSHFRAGDPVPTMVSQPVNPARVLVPRAVSPVTPRVTASTPRSFGGMPVAPVAESRAPVLNTAFDKAGTSIDRGLAFLDHIADFGLSQIEKITGVQQKVAEGVQHARLRRAALVAAGVKIAEGEGYLDPVLGKKKGKSKDKSGRNEYLQGSGRR